MTGSSSKMVNILSFTLDGIHVDMERLKKGEVKYVRSRPPPPLLLLMISYANCKRSLGTSM